MPLGGIAGFVDATAGGGWGPIGTPALLANGKMEPRKVIGSVSTSEFVVTLAASIGFLTALGFSGIQWEIVIGLLVGGVIVAPFAAMLVKVIPARMLGSLVGGLIVLTNSRTLINADLVRGAQRRGHRHLPRHRRRLGLRRQPLVARPQGRHGRAGPPARERRRLSHGSTPAHTCSHLWRNPCSGGGFAHFGDRSLAETNQCRVGEIHVTHL